MAFFRLWARLVGVLGLLALVSACSNSSYMAPLPSDVPRAELLRRFVLLDETGRQDAPKDPRGKSPFAAFLAIPEYGTRGQCSTAQIAPGIGMTNAHCVQHGSTYSQDFHVVYFSKKQHHQASAAVTSLIYVGSENLDDVALYTVPDEVAADWDAVGLDVEKILREHKVSPDANKAVPGKSYDKDEAEKLMMSEVRNTEDITIWGFDPLSSRPEHQTGTREFGMVFSPKHCRGDHTIPWTRQGYASAKVRKMKIESRMKLDPDVHMFIDSCNTTPMSGNSGSLMMTRAFDKIIGAFHWAVPKRSFESDEYFFGTALKWLNVWGGDIPGSRDTAVLNIGTSLEPVVKKNSTVKTALDLAKTKTTL